MKVKKSKIFRKVQYSDGGPNDRGSIVGYISADSKEEAKKILNVNHGFLQVEEISWESYYKEKSHAEARLKSFKF